MNRAKRKGSKFEVDVVELLRGLGFPYAERRALRGVHDAGDAAEAKARRDIDLAGWVTEAERKPKTAGAKSFGGHRETSDQVDGEAYVVMSLEQFCRLVGD